MKENKYMKLALPKAVFLDLDDTITSFELHSVAAWEQTCREFIAEFEPSFSADDFLGILTQTRKWYWSDPDRHKRGRNNMIMARREIVHEAVRKYAGDNYFENPEKEEAVHSFADNYSKLQNQLIQPLPGAVEALELMKEKGLRLAIVTNGAAKIQMEKLARFNLTKYFDEIFTDTEIGYSKPDERIFRYALDKMNLKPSEVWMMGDNIRWDVGGPQAVGIFSVWVNTKNTVIPEGFEIQPDITCSSLYEAAKILVT